MTDGLERLECALPPEPAGLVPMATWPPVGPGRMNAEHDSERILKAVAMVRRPLLLRVLEEAARAHALGVHDYQPTRLRMPTKASSHFVVLGVDVAIRVRNAWEDAEVAVPLQERRDEQYGAARHFGIAHEGLSTAIELAFEEFQRFHRGFTAFVRDEMSGARVEHMY